MFLVEEKTSPGGGRSAEIYMRDDGLFEGRIYSAQSTQSDNEFEICGVTETLPRLKAIVDEELGF